MVEQEQKERKAFEAWAASVGLSTQTHHQWGGYWNDNTAKAWESWKARGEHGVGRATLAQPNESLGIALQDAQFAKKECLRLQESEAGITEDLHQLIRVALTNPGDLRGFIQANYPKEYEEHASAQPDKPEAALTFGAGYVAGARLVDGKFVGYSYDIPAQPDKAEVVARELREKLRDLAMRILPYYHSLNWADGTADAVLLVVRPYLSALPPQRDDSGLVAELVGVLEQVRERFFPRDHPHDRRPRHRRSAARRHGCHRRRSHDRRLLCREGADAAEGRSQGVLSVRRWIRARVWRVNRWREQAFCRHDWMNGVHPVTFASSRRTCRKCIKSQIAVIRWKKPHSERKPEKLLLKCLLLTIATPFLRFKDWLRERTER